VTPAFKALVVPQLIVWSVVGLDYTFLGKINFPVDFLIACGLLAGSIKKYRRETSEQDQL